MYYIMLKRLSFRMQIKKLILSLSVNAGIFISDKYHKVWNQLMKHISIMRWILSGKSCLRTETGSWKTRNIGSESHGSFR